MKKIIVLIAVGLAVTTLYSSENNRKEISSVSFSGNENYTVRVLRKQLQLREPFLFRRTTFDRRLLKLDAITLKNFYISNGYLEATVSDSFFIQDGKADLYFRISEGPRYYLKDVKVQGNRTLSEKKIKQILGLKVNKPYNPIDVNSNLPALDGEYHRFGKLFTSIKLTSSINDSVEINLELKEGPDVYINTSRIQGADKVDSSYIRREIQFNNGDLFQKEKLDRTQKILLETGFFSSINIVPDIINNSDSTVNVLLKVKEFEKRGEVTLEPGYFPVEWSEGINELVGLGGYVEWLDRMVLGSKTRFTSRAAAVLPTEEGYRFPRLSLEMTLFNTRPFPEWVIPFRIPTELNIFYQQFKNYGNEDGPYIRRFGLELKNNFQIINRSFVEFGLQWQRFNDVDIFSDTTLSKSENIEQRKMTLDVHFDNRDNPFYPRSGNFFILNIESSGGILGGTRSFTKIEADYRQYGSILNLITIAWRINLGQIDGWDDSYETVETVLFEKFYLGGSNTLRAWKPLRFYQKFINGLPSPIGKTNKILTNWELRFPLFWRIGGTLFMDGGLIADSYSHFTMTNLQWDLGAGLSIHTPFGPIRVDYAQATENPDIWQVHLGFLYAF